MKAFVFVSDADHPTRAISTDPRGGNLPPAPGGDWRPEGQVDLAVDGGGQPFAALDRQRVADDLARDGCVLLPADPTTPRPENQKRQL